MVSAKLMPAALTSIRTCPSRACGSGRSWTCRTSGGPFWVMTTARNAPQAYSASGSGSHGRGDLGPGAEELAVPGQVPDHHQDGAEDEEADSDDQRRTDAEPGVARRRVLGIVEVDARLDEHGSQDERAEQRQETDHDK